MTNIPDAPWIRDAELNGFGDDIPTVHCPVCGEECEEIYTYKDGYVAGCEHCIEHQDAYQWYELYGKESDE